MYFFIFCSHNSLVNVFLVANWWKQFLWTTSYCIFTYLGSFLLLSAAPFRSCHSGSSASIAPYSLPPLKIKSYSQDTVVRIYQARINGRMLISTQTLVFINLDVSMGHDQISHWVPARVHRCEIRIDLPCSIIREERGGMLDRSSTVLLRETERGLRIYR